MRLEQLRYLVATIDHGTMTAAATAVHVTQPALTRAVRGLERELGVVLLQREGNRLVPTDAGQRVVDAARRVVADVAAIEAVARADIVRVRTTPTQERELVRGAVARMLAAGGPTVIVTSADTAEAVFEAVASGHADVGVADHTEHASLPGEVLGWQEVVLICPTGWDVTDPLPVSRLADLPVVAPAPGSSRRQRMDAGLAALGVQPLVAAVTDQADLGVSLAMRGVVGAFGYRTQADEAQARGATVVRLDPPVRRPVGWVHRVRLTAAARAFVDGLRAEAADVLDPVGLVSATARS